MISMKPEGLDAIRRHVPEIKSSTDLLKPVLGIGAVFLATALFFALADARFAEWMPDGEIVILALGFLILSRFFSQRRRYQEKFGERAYQAAVVRFAIPGLGMIGACLAHLAYIAGPEIPPIWWRAWLMALGWVLLAIGVLTWWRAVASAGLATLAMLYVYHPDEGSQLQGELYRLVRHPIYSAAMNIAWGLALVHASWYALLSALIIPLFFWGWIRLFEEPDLLQRFSGYAEYRRRVPAFSPSLANTLKFYGILLAGR